MDFLLAGQIGTSPNVELVNTMIDHAIASLTEEEKQIFHSDYTKEKTIPKSLLKSHIY
jgi:hypothetical protein